MENEEQKQIEEQPKPEEVVEQTVEQIAEDRPAKNWEAEIARHKANEDRLRAELEAEKSRQVHRYDPNDMKTWGENDLRAVANTIDPQYMHLKERANDELLERKVSRIRERERAQEKRVTSEMELRTKYPDALDPYSEFSAKMEQIMYDNDLQKTPAGRLIAAKLVAAELKPKTKSSDTRIKDIKAQMVDGDRPKPQVSDVPKKEDLVKQLNEKNLKRSADAMGELLKQQGLTSDTFFKR